MISRVAEQCFWFGRYIDRAESTARLLQVTRTLVFDADIPVTQCWRPLVIVSGELPSFVARHGEAAVGNGDIIQRYMTWEPENLVSLRKSISAARESARAIREALSLEAWEEVNELYLWFGREDADRLYRENREHFYRRVRNSAQLILGLVRSTMLHDTPMSFLWLGVMLERVGQTARILDMHHHTMSLETQHQIVEVALWLSLLHACSGHEAFVKKSQGRISAHSVAAFLLFDARFPRSLRYCLRSACRIVGDIWPDGAQRPSRTQLAELSDWLDTQEGAFAPKAIHDLLTRVVDSTTEICSHIGQEILGPPETATTAAQAQTNQ